MDGVTTLMDGMAVDMKNLTLLLALILFSDRAYSCGEEELVKVVAGQVTDFGKANPKTGKPKFISNELHRLLGDYEFYVGNIEALEMDIHATELAQLTGDIPFDFVPMTPEQIRQANADIAQLKVEVKQVESDLAIQFAAEIHALNKAGQKALQHSRAREFEILLRTERASALSKKAQTVFLPGDSLSPQDIAVLNGLKQRGYLVWFDADTAAAKAIQDTLGTQGIGVSSTHSNNGAWLVENDYIKMNLLCGSRVIANANSPSLLASALNHSQIFMTNGSRTQLNDLNRWKKALNENKMNAGVKYGKILDYPDASTLFDYVDTKDAPVFPFLSAPVLGELAAIRGSEENLITAQGWGNNAQAVLGIASALENFYGLIDAKVLVQNVPGGSVFFGSSKLRAGWNEKVLEAARVVGRLGIGVWTGGAGGMMRVANTGAFLSGAESVGIPIAGRNQLASETKVYGDIQTLTIPVPGYPTRIPMLLHKKELVVAVPGGDGTMKEIAVWLTQARRGENPNSQLILFDKQYYRPLFDFLMSSPTVSQDIRDRIHLVNEVPALVDLIRSLHQNGKVEASATGFGRPVNSRPINPEALKFEKPKKDKGGKR